MIENEEQENEKKKNEEKKEKEEKEIELTSQTIYDIIEEICKTEEIFKKKDLQNIKSIFDKKRIF